MVLLDGVVFLVAFVLEVLAVRFELEAFLDAAVVFLVALLETEASVNISLLG